MASGAAQRERGVALLRPPSSSETATEGASVPSHKTSATTKRQRTSATTERQRTSATTDRQKLFGFGTRHFGYYERYLRRSGPKTGQNVCLFARTLIEIPIPDR